jgi:hypothetical protein
LTIVEPSGSRFEFLVIQASNPVVGWNSKTVSDGKPPAMGKTAVY